MTHSLSGKTLPPSLWADTAPPLAAQPPLQGEATCDVAIIGAGFTGLRCALGLAEAGASVRVLEAREVGFGNDKSFARAFRAWSGTTPDECRRAARAEPQAAVPANAARS